MQTPAGDTSPPSSTPHAHSGAPPDDAPAIVGPGEPARTSEELTVLYFGFAFGLTIAFVFLIYVVLEFARYLT